MNTTTNGFILSIVRWIPSNTALPEPTAPVKVCAGIVCVNPVNDGTPVGHVTMPAAETETIAVGTLAGQSTEPETLTETCACGTDAGQFIVTSAVALCESMIAPVPAVVAFRTTGPEALADTRRKPLELKLAETPNSEVARKETPVFPVVK